ncbi:ATP-binding protein [Salidesulfovibrio brasiliensis]|uniref:ATP-binding protein n=1 Tax=Salidesulfovibrio brasiliensis TaxID=221711 RepID=UPI0009FB6024|nr:ATP-binding protein [Salidesulfovibrio brasiliensis]
MMSLFRSAWKRFDQASLKNKLVFSMLVGVMFISVAIAFIARWILVSSLTRELEMRGSAIAHSIAERGGGYILDRDHPRLLALIFDEARLHERRRLVSYIFIEDLEGDIVAHTLTQPLPESLTVNSVPDGAVRSVEIVSFFGNPAIDIAVPIKEGLYRIGTVHVGLSKSHIDNLISKLRVAFLGFISGIVLIAVYLSNRLSHYITRPISNLTEIADEISRGNFDIPINLGTAKAWDPSDCPAFCDSNLPCWHFDLSVQERADLVSSDTYKACNRCLFYGVRKGDEVVQLADSFRNMVWSIKLYRRRLRESEEKYRSLFDSGPDPVFVLDCETGQVIDANPRVQDLYGYDRTEVAGVLFSEFWPEYVAGSFDSHTSSSDCIYYPKVLHYKRRGEPFYVNMHACAISYKGRRAVIVSATDITEMIEKDAQLIQAGKMKSLGEMSAGIAHELNQPLNAIKMGSEFMLMMDDGGVPVTPEQYRDVVREMSAQVDRASGIINTLRSFGRKSDFVRERVPVNAVVTDVLSILKRQFELDNITFDLDLAEGRLEVLGHNNRLQQVLFNLVTNARDAINDKDQEDGRRIGIRTWSDSGRVFIEVEDSGGGIPADVLDKVFEPFFTTKEAGQGMGLGLAISYGIVKDYGGSMNIESNPPQGTRFILELPAAPERESA